MWIQRVVDEAFNATQLKHPDFKITARVIKGSNDFARYFVGAKGNETYLRDPLLFMREDNCIKSLRHDYRDNCGMFIEFENPELQIHAGDPVIETSEHMPQPPVRRPQGRGTLQLTACQVASLVSAALTAGFGAGVAYMAANQEETSCWFL